ncbi:OsmC family protein [Lederbergia wuyishanensis]|uniref:OsmC-like protein n=1 Tax=Lederbergia wuyishanensis TaxID=1347903 RepID=A0ABU0D2D2_9BACI|nr:OsmC family protein [Lederbergia wuyishanensis]MCJ8007289.1 OsmC family protein [Lederbergia wuyishanensis]MDQ0342554.1 putative OsmC-like protein [Lederbergia wuyishanensis]
MKIKENIHIRSIEVNTEWKKKVQTEHFVRGFQFLIDEPHKLGGDNEAPTPLEYVLGSFNGCVLVVIDLAAKELGFQYDNIEITSNALIDRRGLAGTADVSPYYQSVENNIVFYTSESDERLQELKEIVIKRCPLYNLLKNAGVAIHLNWTIQ